MTIKELKDKLSDFPDDMPIANVGKVKLIEGYYHPEEHNGRTLYNFCYALGEHETHNFGCCQRTKQLNKGNNPVVKAVSFQITRSF